VSKEVFSLELKQVILLGIERKTASFLRQRQAYDGLHAPHVLVVYLRP
jgi:hypothetical protein